MRQVYVVLLTVVLALLVVGMFGFLLYKLITPKHQVMYRSSLIPYPSVRLDLPEAPGHPFLVFTDSNDNLTKQYCDKYGLDIVTVPPSEAPEMLLHAFHIMRDKKYEYVILLMNALPWNPDSGKPVQRLVQQSSDSDLIVCRHPGDPGQLDTRMFIFKNSEWSQYKCFQLHFNPSRVQSVLMDQVYTSFQHKTLLEVKDQLDLGLPFVLQCMCVYNEKAFNLDSAPADMYPWAGVQGFIEIPRHVMPTERAANQRIPRVIYQTMSSTLVNYDRYRYSVQAWQQLNPEYEYKFIDDVDMRRFIEKHFDADVVKAYNMLLPGAYQADLFRYCLLYVHGGCYVDSQTQPFIPLREVIKPDSQFVSARDLFDFGVLQCFLCCLPKHPVLELVIKKTVANVLKRKYKKHPVDPTGPNILGKCLNTWLGRKATQNVKHGLPSTIKLLDSDYSDNYKRYQKNEQYFIYLDSRPFILIKYLYNKAQLSTTSPISLYQLINKEDYRSAHKNRRVFKQPLLLH